VTQEKVYTALFPFCGIGGGALGFRDATVELFGKIGQFRVVGGIDFDAAACADFETITGAPALCCDIKYLSSEKLLQLCPESPDVVFLSPPCKGASGLLPAEKAKTAKYQAMNRLALDWIELMLSAWDTPPRVVLFENVPRLKQRAAGMLKQVRSLLRGSGYVLHDGFHECGELGGLAQVRRRYLLVARHAKRVPPLLYQPPKQRVRGCGEVLGELPLPGADAGGPMHRLPRLSWLNWVRLSLIPAGGDWRDLEGVLRDGQARREVFKRHGVQRWEEPASTVAGSGSNGPSAVADPRISFTCNPNAHQNKFAVADWSEPAGTVMGATRPGSGAPSVADPRLAELIQVPNAFDHGYGVLRFDEPSSTVAGGSQVGQGAYSVADPRWGGGGLGVIDWGSPSGTITGNARPSTGRFTVADPRLGCEPRSGTYGVISWENAARTIIGSARIDNGAFAVADPRKPPANTPVIIAADGTWHRPITTLELAALQSLPTTINGVPLVLHGKSHTSWRERIGNCVPSKTARAIGERILVALLEADLGGFSLSGNLMVWVNPAEPVTVSGAAT
jgi:site-specific DNA-cytosine methylase